MGCIPFQLLPEIPDMGINGPFISLKTVPALGTLHELHATENTARRRGQHLQQIKFCRSKRYCLPVTGNGKFLLINNQISPYKL